MLRGSQKSTAQRYATDYGYQFKQTDDPSADMTYTGSIMLDTSSYQMAPGNIYDIGVTLVGTEGKLVTVRSSRDGIANVTKLSNGNYRVTALNPGITYIIFEISDGSQELTHASVGVTVKTGVTQGGVSAKNISYFV